MHAAVATLRRSPTLAPIALGLCAIAVVVYWISQSIAREEYRNLLIGIVLIQTMWVFVRWRTSIYLFMGYVVVEGFLVNYFWNRPELNLLKDVLACSMFAALALALARWRLFPMPRSRWLLPFAAFAVIYMAQVFNPNLPNVLVGLVGVRVTLLYAVLVPISYWFILRREDGLRLFAFMLALSLPVSLFGIYQYFRGPEWMVSLSPGFERAVFYAYGGGGATRGYFRTFSTFVQTGGFSHYLLFMMLLCIAFWLAPSFRKYRLLVLLLFVTHLLALLTTGGRTAVALFGAGLLFLFVLQKGGARALPLLILVPVVFWSSLFLVDPAIGERYAALLDLEFVSERNFTLFYWWLYSAMDTEWTGLGAGYASVASRHAGATPLNAFVVENGLAKIRFEAGIPGLIAFVVFVLVFAWDCLVRAKRCHDPDLNPIAMVCAVFVLLNLLTLPFGTPFEVSPGNVYLWFFAGFLLRAPELAPREEPGSPPAKE
jgi:hypothetical protein